MWTLEQSLGILTLSYLRIYSLNMLISTDKKLRSRSNASEQITNLSICCWFVVVINRLPIRFNLSQELITLRSEFLRSTALLNNHKIDIPEHSVTVWVPNQLKRTSSKPLGQRACQWSYLLCIDEDDRVVPSSWIAVSMTYMSYHNCSETNRQIRESQICE